MEPLKIESEFSTSTTRNIFSSVNFSRRLSVIPSDMPNAAVILSKSGMEILRMWGGIEPANE
jgi:hypothetical protein